MKGPGSLKVRLIGHLDRVRYAEIRDSRSPYRLSAVVREVSGPEGKLTVLGGGPLFSLTFVVLLLSNLLMLPILALLALIIVLAIPWIVRRSFAGLAVVARQAEEIDIGRRGTRLPDERIPAEVKPLVKAINGALQRLDEGYERHQRFIADAAHELRTPIAILQTRIESMADGALRHRLLADTGRIAALAEQLLDLQRLDRPGVGFTRLDLVTLARRVVADLAPLAIAHGYNLSFESETEHVPVQGDAGALERALLNIVQNAIEHSGRSGDIQVLVGRDGSVSVSDQGPGIPEAERERIFEPFHRLHPRNQGAGLGLNLVREILAHHGGQVVVLDSPGGGACFRISLPCRGEPTTSGL